MKNKLFFILFVPFIFFLVSCGGTKQVSEKVATTPPASIPAYKQEYSVDTDPAIIEYKKIFFEGLPFSITEMCISTSSAESFCFNTNVFNVTQDMLDKESIFKKHIDPIVNNAKNNLRIKKTKALEGHESAVIEKRADIIDGVLKKEEEKYLNKFFFFIPNKGKDMFRWQSFVTGGGKKFYSEGGNLIMLESLSDGGRTVIIFTAADE